MAEFPTVADIFAPLENKSGLEANTAIHQWYDAMFQLPGAKPTVTLTITDDALTPTSADIMVNTEGNAPADNLQTIALGGTHDGMRLSLRAASESRTVLVKHQPAVINGITLLDGIDKELSVTDEMVLKRDGDRWREVRSGSKGMPKPYANTVTALSGNHIYGHIQLAGNGELILTGGVGTVGDWFWLYGYPGAKITNPVGDIVLAGTTFATAPSGTVYVLPRGMVGLFYKTTATAWVFLNSMALVDANNVVPVANGGTGATTAAAARNAMGLGNTTGALPIVNGGTGATTAEGILGALFGPNTTPHFIPTFDSGYEGRGWVNTQQLRNAMGLGNTTGALPVANGGTGATTAENARTALNAAPRPQNSGGVGNWGLWSHDMSGAVMLPAGGSWAYWYWFGDASFQSGGGVAAGGAVVRTGTQQTNGFYWRIA